ncbi:MAG: hypothetical protein E7660_07230 [Ruminococcaceae bacterium]|nr:hypothetical protein [Oscillospiraceae bacterium]
MEYVTHIITLTVIIGVISIIAAGFRLSEGLKILASLLMVTATLLPLLGLFNTEKIIPESFFSEAYVNYSDGSDVYIETCKREIEERLTELLSNKLETEEVNVCITLDASDISSVDIAEVTVFINSEASKVKELIRDNTGCGKISVKEYR